MQSARDVLQAALVKAKEAADPDAAFQMAWDAWQTFAAFPPVAKLLSTAEPATSLALKTFYAAHDALVVTPIWKRAFEGTAQTLTYASTTSAYK